MNWSKNTFAGIKRYELAAVVGAYLLFSLIYRITLYASWPEKKTSELFSLEKWWDSAGLQYGLMLLATGVIWLFIFKVFKSWSLWKRLLLHIFGLPFFLFAAWYLYYAIEDQFDGLGHLSGSAQIWDIYIPTLLYFVQFGIFHAYAYFRENQKKLIVEGELRQAALKSELSAIKAQLNPHFLYNVFNTINASLPPEQENTRNMIAKLSDLFRYQLRASRHELVPLKDELEFVEKYLELEKKRFGDRLKINVQVAAELMEELIPPMILQPIVENAVKHGLSSLVEGGQLDISILRQDGKLFFRVSDTGVGVADKTQLLDKGVGLSNTELRLQKMYKSSLQFLDNQPKGLTVQFSL
ncbi:MAG: histidine kinase [Bacteroidota bacterium]